MKGFRKLVALGVVLVTLLVVIDMIDAGKKESKKKEIQGKNINENDELKITKLKKSEGEKLDKSKTFNRNKAGKLDDYKQTGKDFKIEKNKINHKKNVKKDHKIIEESANPKIIKTYQKVKKYKIVEDGPAKKFASSKTKLKSIKSQRNNKEETIDEVVKSLKKTTQKKISKDKNNIKELVIEEENGQNDDNIIVNEEEEENTPKSKKSKVMENVIQEEDGEPQEGNETILESDELAGIKRTESEEVIEKFKTTQTLKLPKRKTVLLADDEEDINEDSTNEEETFDSELNEELSGSDIDSFSSDNEDSTFKSCKPLPEDPYREGPKKLTLYVIEEEVDGQIKKRVVTEEDGVTTCEIADLLHEHYYSGLP